MGYHERTVAVLRRMTLCLDACEGIRNKDLLWIGEARTRCERIKRMHIIAMSKRYAGGTMALTGESEGSLAEMTALSPPTPE